VRYLSEQPYFYNHLTAYESLRFAAQLYRIAPSDIGSEIKRALQMVELQSHVDKTVKKMSKGMAQRLNMAQVLLGQPRLLILDEPMSGLDPLGRILFRNLITRMHEQGTTVFFSTHALDDIESLCRRLILVNKGRSLYQGSVEEILTRGEQGYEVQFHSVAASLHESLEKFAIESTGTAQGSRTYVCRSADLRNSLLKTAARKDVVPQRVAVRRRKLIDVIEELIVDSERLDSGRPDE
jgi:ABC-2 type transport system ATP-binding protein